MTYAKPSAFRKNDIMSETYRGIGFAYRNRFLIFLTIMVLKFADYCQKLIFISFKEHYRRYMLYISM